MARSRRAACRGKAIGIAGTATIWLLTSGLAGAQSEVRPAPTPFSAECREGSVGVVQESPLPNATAALRRGKTIKILSIGAAAGRRGRGRYASEVERLLERAVKDLDVVTINRPVSGELAEQAARRIRLEVALHEPDLLLWQVGTNDALAYVPLGELEETVVDTIRWLKEHNIDVVLVGLQYVDHMAQDENYAAVRILLRKIARQENVVIIRRYEAMQMLSGGPGPQIDEFERTETGYGCLAQYVARAITLGVFGRGLRPVPPNVPPPPGSPAYKPDAPQEPR